MILVQQCWIRVSINIKLIRPTLWSNKVSDSWNIFDYFTLKALCVFQIFTFDPDVLVTQRNSLIRKLLWISRFMASQTKQQILPVHMLHNISRNKDNHTMKTGQLKKNMRHIFLHKSWRKWCWETISRPFSVFQKKKIM